MWKDATNDDEEKFEELSTDVIMVRQLPAIKFKVEVCLSQSLTSSFNTARKNVAGIFIVYALQLNVMKFLLF